MLSFLFLALAAPNAHAACFALPGDTAPRFCVDRVVYEAFDATLKKPALVVSGAGVAGTYAITATESLSGQTVRFTAERTDTTGDGETCGAVAWVTTRIATTYDFTNAIDPAKLAVEREVTSTPDSCHMALTTTTVKYEVR
jgi:hydroxymethylpyrimidine/phosphomethylpyrimidine kinase